MKTAVAMGLVLLGFSAALPAQQTLVGKYSGNMVQKTKESEAKVGLTLEITSAQDGKLRGKVVRDEKEPCAGTYDVEGSYQADKIVIRSRARTGAEAKCAVRLQLTAGGDKLVGHSDFRAVELVRQ